MSRSYKKHPIKKDSGDKSYNKRFRKANKMRIQKGKEPFHRTSEVVSDYDVCDWIFDRWNASPENKEEHNKFKRK